MPYGNERQKNRKKHNSRNPEFSSGHAEANALCSREQRKPYEILDVGRGVQASQNQRSCVKIGTKGSFAPTKGSQTLGTATVPYNDDVQRGDKGGLTLGGTTTGNTVKEVRFEGGNRYADLRKEGTGTWTLGNVSVGTLRMASGTLIINGTVNLPYSGLQFSGGTLAGDATINVPVTVPATGNLAPGGPVGALSVRGDLDLSAQAGGAGKLIFELDALDAVSDRIEVTGTANIGNGVLGLSDFDFSNLGGMEAGTYVLIGTTEGIVGSLDPKDRVGKIGNLHGNLQIKGKRLEWASDSDGDGMPDDFELADTVETNTRKHKDATDTGTNPLDPNTDGDNAGDWFELYGCYTDPNDPVDKPSLPYPLPKPDFSRTNEKKPVKVFILSGQSNMVGFGRTDGSGPGTLANMVKVLKRFTNLVDKDGNWIANRNVMYRGVISDIGKGPLSPVVAGSSFGPELGFGQVMDYVFEEPVLLIKSSIGNRSLNWDCLPPGSNGFNHSDGYTYAGYGESPGRWPTDEDPVPIWWYAGKQYDDFFLHEADMGPQTWANGTDYPKSFQVRRKGVVYVSKAEHTSSTSTEPGTGADWSNFWSGYSVFNVTDVLDNFATEYPQWADQGFEIAGFVWWQGHKDQGEPAASRYENSLVNLIKSLRQYYGTRYPGRIAPDAPFVLATIAFGGWDLSGDGLTVAKGQLAVSDETRKHPEFTGNVKTVEARGYWRDASISPKNQGFHYNHNAETYLLVGDALGRAMADLLRSDSETTP